MRHILLALPLFGLLPSLHSALAIDLTQCGQVVPAGEVGILRNDITCDGTTPGLCPCLHHGCFLDTAMPCTSDADCRGCKRIAVRVGRRATLELGGFSVLGVVGESHIGILCEGGCEIRGPGDVARFTTGVQTGVRRPSARAHLSDLTIRENYLGVDGLGSVSLAHVTLSGNGSGISGGSVRVEDVSVLGNGGGIGARTVGGHDLTVNDNATYGVTGFAWVRMTGLIAMNNGLGLRTRATRLRDSTLTGNQFGDLATQALPRIDNTTCGTSIRLDADLLAIGTWGVCSGD